MCRSSMPSNTQSLCGMRWGLALVLVATASVAWADGRADRPDRPDPTQSRFFWVPPEFGVVSFNQVIWNFENARSGFSDWGSIVLDVNRIQDIAAGNEVYINVLVSSSPGGRKHWVVENLYIPGATCTADGSVTPRPEIALSRYLDLVPESSHVRRRVRHIHATVLASEQPAPVAEVMFRELSTYPLTRWPVGIAVENAEGFVDDPDLGTRPPSNIDQFFPVGMPPQPLSPPPGPIQDLAYPVCVMQDPSPNIECAVNQCVPMAVANTVQYLEDRYSGGMLVWLLPELPVPGYGEQFVFGDNLFWQPVPEASLIAQIDAFTRRAGTVSPNTGSGANLCQLYSGLFRYLNAASPFTDANFTHQGSSREVYAAGQACGDEAILWGDRMSVREGVAPTWQWMFDKLAAGQGVFICFGRYDVNGARTSGHCVRVYGACRFNGRDYIYTLDDGEQGNNNAGLRTQMWEVADTGGPGAPGVPDGLLNLDDLSWEIEFAVAVEAVPTLFVP